MVDCVAGTIAKHRMLRPGERVGVAVSGGPDSVALLHCLRKLASRLEITLAIVHFNHRTRRKESDADQRFVEDLGRQLHLKLQVSCLDVPAIASARGQNLEEIGRNVRYEFFKRLIVENQVDKIATGHTRSDQAETVLYRLLRGSGSAGLAGIRPQLDWGGARPLIDCTRAQVLEYLRVNGYQWREDSTNRDPLRARNRIRHQLLPQLENECNPNLTKTLSHLADWAQGEESYWEDILPALACKHLEQTADGFYFQADELTNLPVGAARRLLRFAIEKSRGGLRGVDFEHVESLLRLAAKSKGTGWVDLPGLRAQRSFNEVRVRKCRLPSNSGSNGYSLALEAPGRFAGPWGASLVTLKLYNRENLPGNRGYNGESSRVLDWDKVPKPLRLRNWRPGDRYHPQGRTGPKKLKSLFHEGRIAAWERFRWPVMVGKRVSVDAGTLKDAHEGERIVWTRRFGPAAEFAPDDKSRVLLEISEVLSPEGDFLVSDS